MKLVIRDLEPKEEEKLELFLEYSSLENHSVWLCAKRGSTEPIVLAEITNDGRMRFIQSGLELCGLRKVDNGI